MLEVVSTRASLKPVGGDGLFGSDSGSTQLRSRRCRGNSCSTLGPRNMWFSRPKRRWSAIELPDAVRPLTVTPPLRILGVISSPSDLPELDGERERLRIQDATAELQQRGLLEVTWLSNATWRDLQHALRRQRWHIVHFVGHGEFDTTTDEGAIALEDDNGRSFRLSATDLGRLLGDHDSLRLVLLNACESARGSKHDAFSSTAAPL